MTFEQRIKDLETLIEKVEADCEESKIFRELVESMPLIFYLTRLREEIHWLKYFKEQYGK